MNHNSKPTNYQMALTVGDGTRLEIQSDRITGQDFYVIVSPGLGHTGMSICIEADQAPAVALAILTAAGVTPHHGTSRCIGDRMDMWAVRYLTDHVEAQAEDAAEKELTRRKDELAREIYLKATGEDDGDTYAHRNHVTRAAIDMIIQLQDEAQK